MKMANIAISFDTKTKKASVSIDGQQLDAEYIDYIRVAQMTDYEEGGKKWGCDIGMSVRNKEDGMSMYTSICANLKDEVNIIKDEQSELQKSIANLYRSKNGTGS